LYRIFDVDVFEGSMRVEPLFVFMIAVFTAASQTLSSQPFAPEFRGEGLKTGGLD
jgi:hypothetical protein